jgi:hypothetical protein
MASTAITIMALAVVGLIACRFTGVRELHILRGASVRVTFVRPASALDSNFVVITVPLRAPLFVLLFVGLVLFIVVGGYL